MASPRAAPPSRPLAANVLSCVAVGAILAAWLVAKLRLFDGLEYTSDIIHNTAKCRSFLWGYPLLYDERFGPHPYHNDFLQLALAPLAYAWGSVGLIVGSWAVYLAAFGSWLRHAIALPTAAKRTQLATMALLLGPVGFWVWDDPVYGWHPETLAVPLVVMLALCLRESRVLGTVVVSVALLLLHEGGALIGASVCLIHYAVRPSLAIGSRIGRAAVVTAGWTAAFLGGLALQRVWDPAGADRLRAALEAARTVPLAGEVALMLALLGAVLATSGLVLFAFPWRPRALAVTLACSVPVVLSGIVASLAYGNAVAHDNHNLLWPPRFAFVWAVVVAGLILSSTAAARREPSRVHALVLAGLVAASLISQHVALRAIRGYDVVQRLAGAARGRRGLFAGRYTPAELGLLDCLRERVPRRTPVYLDPSLWAMLHTHDIDGYRVGNPYRRFPELLVCDLSGRDPYRGGCLALTSPRRHPSPELHFDGLSLRYRLKLTPIVEACVTVARRQG